MTHSDIALLKKCNSLIDNDLEDLTFSTLLGTLKKISGSIMIYTRLLLENLTGLIPYKSQKNQISLRILFLLCCFASYVHSQSPQQAIQQSKAHLTKAAWFLKLPQYNRDSAEFYFDRAVNVLNKNEPKHFQATSEAYFKLHFHFYRSHFTPKVDDALTKARYFYDKIPNKSEATKPLEYEILFYETHKSFNTGDQTKANNLMLKAFSWIQEQKSPEMQAKFLYSKGFLYAKTRDSKINDAVKLGYACSLQSKKLYEDGNSKEKNEMLFKVYSNLTWYHNSYATADSADYYFDKQKALLPLLNDSYVTAFYYSLRGNNYMRRNQQDKAVPLLKECQELLEKYKLTQNQVYIFNIYVQGVREVEIKKYDEAIFLFQKGLEAAKKINHAQFITDGFSHLSNAYKEKGDFETALKFQVKYHDVEFAEYDKNLSKSLKENELKLDIVKKENQITQKAKEQKWYIGALLAGLFLLILVYRNFRSCLS